MNRPPARHACAAALLATACAPAAAQTITTTGIAGVPVGGAFALGALALLLAALAARALPRGARTALLLAAVALAGAQWGGQPLVTPANQGPFSHLLCGRYINHRRRAGAGPVRL